MAFNILLFTICHADKLSFPSSTKTILYVIKEMEIVFM